MEQLKWECNDEQLYDTLEYLVWKLDDLSFVKNNVITGYFLYFVFYFATFDIPIFRFWAYMMKVSPNVRRISTFLLQRFVFVLPKLNILLFYDLFFFVSSKANTFVFHDSCFFALQIFKFLWKQLKIHKVIQ